MAQWEDAYDRAEGLAKVRFTDRVNGVDRLVPSLSLSLALRGGAPPQLSRPYPRSPPFSQAPLFTPYRF